MSISKFDTGVGENANESDFRLYFTSLAVGISQVNFTLPEKCLIIL